MLATKKRAPLVLKEGESSLSEYRKVGDAHRDSVTRYYANKVAHNLAHLDERRKSQLNSTFMRSSTHQNDSVNYSFGEFFQQLKATPQSSMADYQPAQRQQDALSRQIAATQALRQMAEEQLVRRRALPRPTSTSMAISTRAGVN